MTRWLGFNEAKSHPRSTLHPVNMVGENFVAYPVQLDEDTVQYRGVIGVEYGTYVYCDKPDGKFYYVEPIRGALPSRDELIINNKYGSVAIPVHTNNDKHIMVALVHTHNISPLVISHTGRFEPGLPRNSPASDDDRYAANLARVPNYIVFESNPGGYYFGDIASP